MALSYNPLWKLLIDRGLKKSDLNKITGISESTMAKLAKSQNVNTKILDRICSALNCNISDIVEYKKEGSIIFEKEGYKNGE